MNENKTTENAFARSNNFENSINDNKNTTENKDLDPNVKRMKSFKSLKSLMKLPLVKKAKLVSKSAKKLERTRPEKPHGLAETKIYYLPLMPTDEDEKNAYIEKEFRCSFCSELCDVENLECKVCARVFHIQCLYNRGYLEKLKVSLKLKWTCADCSDLTKILTDEEVRKIINIFDELDTKKEGFVQYQDFMSTKRKLFEEKGYYDIEERLAEEERIFKLIDSDDTGFITWNEFCEFEAASLLTKKNKIELSNHLTMNELIQAKKKFLSYNQNNAQMIAKKDARDCYIKYVKQLEKKLGPAFMEHMYSCAELLSLNTKENDKKTTAKTIWPEFIRKMTILILFDRINSDDFKPKHYRPKIFDIVLNERLERLKSIQNEQKLSEINQINKFNINDKLSGSSYMDESLAKNSTISSNTIYATETLTSKQILPPIEPQAKHKLEIIENDDHELDKLNKNNYFSIEELMSENMQLDNFKPHYENEFGSFQFMIRSKHLASNLSFSSGEESEFYRQTDSTSELEQNGKKSFQRHNQLKPLVSQSFNLKGKRISKINNNNGHNSNSLESFGKSYYDAKNNNNNNYNNNSNYYKQNYSQSFKFNRLNQTLDNDSSIITSQYGFSTSYLNANNSSKINKPIYEYNKISNDIYKIFGRQKNAINYPQQISELNKLSNNKNFKTHVNSDSSSIGSLDKIMNLKEGALSIFSDDMTSARNMLNTHKNKLLMKTNDEPIEPKTTKKNNLNIKPAKNLIGILSLNGITTSKNFGSLAHTPT